LKLPAAKRSFYKSQMLRLFTLRDHMRRARLTTLSAGGRVVAENERAKQLLLSHLSESQREEYDKLKGFTVITPSGIKWFLTRGIRAANAFRFDPDDARKAASGRAYCGYISHVYPFADNLLAQKLLLESEGGEEIFCQIALRQYDGTFQRFKEIRRLPAG
jgi:hypothetical protein